MRLIELHILQSFPVSCLNRDDVGAPKTAVFGGCSRARISSQCLKRAIRNLARDQFPAARFGGSRSRLIIEPLRRHLLVEGLSEEAAGVYSAQIADLLAGLDEKTVDKTGKAKEGKTPRVSTLIFLSPAEMEALAADVAQRVTSDPKAKLDARTLAKVCNSVPLSDAADIAIFGRMVASDHSLTVEGAGMFSHALSTHKAGNDLDFFSAVDDEKLKEEDAGAGHTNTLEFTSACYYRYAGLNLDLLADSEHLIALSVEERRGVVDAFLRTTVLAVPGARKNSMNANTLPAYVLGVAKEKGQPVQLVNAFEKPVRSGDGLLDASVAALQAHYRQLKATWGLDAAAECAIPEVSLDAFCERMVRHVV
ncbi:MAG: type I-E CRISPR-associated protein Cas7/Cse4/CasC [Lentisphaeria bacterium]|nr:type I-E CRISPR-associated protein Cas7/Cse4/CasC [Lentisphaeria bacterium]